MVLHDEFSVEITSQNQKKQKTQKNATWTTKKGCKKNTKRPDWRGTPPIGLSESISQKKICASRETHTQAHHHPPGGVSDLKRLNGRGKEVST